MLDEKVLIAVLRNHLDHIKEKTKEKSCLVDIELAYGEFIDIVNAQPSIDTWIPVSTRLPKEEINPITDDYCEYMVTVELSDGRKDIRCYKFGDGHWWHFGQCMDKYVVAWKERGAPWEAEAKTNSKTDKQETRMELEMPYGKVVITTPEEAIYFIKNACNKCPRYYICSGNRAKICIDKKQAVIDAFFDMD